MTIRDKAAIDAEVQQIQIAAELWWQVQDSNLYTDPPPANQLSG